MEKSPLNWPFRCSEARDAIALRSSAENWKAFSGWTKTLVPFWIRAIELFAAKTGIPDERRDRYLATARGAFDLMDGWQAGAKKVEARRKEIDSAISFIRNAALDGKVARLLAAPVARNVASPLRSALQIAARSFSEAQIPTVIAQEIYELGFCRTYFPFDTGNFASYLPGDLVIHGSSENADFDHYHLMMEIAAKRLGVETHVQLALEEAGRIWKNLEGPVAWDVPEPFWTFEIGTASKDLHFALQKAFHSR